MTHRPGHASDCFLHSLSAYEYDAGRCDCGAAPKAPPAEIDLEVIKNRPAGRSDRNAEDKAALIAAVESLRVRVVDLEGLAETLASTQCEAPYADKHGHMHCEYLQASEARCVELAAMLQGEVDSCCCCDATGTAHTMADETEVGCAPGSSAIPCPVCTPWRAMIAAMPPEALERARARDNIIDIAREIVSTESAWTSEWVAKDHALKDAFANLDALQGESGA